MCFGKVRFHRLASCEAKSCFSVQLHGHLRHLGGSYLMQSQMSDSVGIIKGVLHFHIAMYEEKQGMDE